MTLTLSTDPRCTSHVRYAIGQTMLALLWVVLAGCSAFGPAVIVEMPSMFGTLVVTDDGDGLRSLRFGRSGITQSTIKVGDPEHLQFGYARLALAGFALLPAPAGAPDPVPMPRRILIVGLGGGSLPVFLHRHYPDAIIDVVEIDPAVVSAAKGYFGFREDARLQVHVGDGRAFIERAPPGQYDVILLDAFGSADVPFHLTTREFLQAVRRALAPTGVVVSNVWSRLYNPLYDAMLRTYQDGFAEVHVLEAAREVNRLVFALPQRQALGAERFAAAARRLSRAQGYRFDLGGLVEGGYVALPPAQPHLPVLRDAGTAQ